MRYSMERKSDYQERHLQAIKGFYSDVNRQTDHHYSMTDVVIAWFTEGHAEVFRRRNLKQKQLLAS